MPKFKNLDGDSRFNFMMALVAYLERRGETTLEEAGAHFNLEPSYIREVVSSVNSLSVELSDFDYAPFMIDADLADQGVLSLLENQIMDSVPRLSSRQAAALGAGLSYLATMPAFANDDELKALQGFLSNGSSLSEIPSIKVVPNSVDENAEQIRVAIASGSRISCEYLNAKGEISTRQIDPLRLDIRTNESYLRGYCLVNKELRNFKLDRMRSIVITDEPISEKARGIQTIEDRLYKAKATDIQVTVELQPEAYGLISELQVLSEPKNLGQGTIQTVITVGHLPNIAKLIARYRGKARVIAPPEAKEYVRNYALKALGEQPIQAIEKVE